MEGFVTSVRENLVAFKDQFGFIHQYPKEKLVQKNPDLYQNIKIEKKAEPSGIKSQKHKKQHMVLDLHFEQLVSQPLDYDSIERLFIQKEKLLETIDFCRKNNLKKLEIIHGIGDGVLQKMVFDVLQSQTNIEFEDHDFFYHSSGSVMVNFK